MLEIPYVTFFLAGLSPLILLGAFTVILLIAAVAESWFFSMVSLLFMLVASSALQVAITSGFIFSAWWLLLFVVCLYAMGDAVGDNREDTDYGPLASNLLLSSGMLWLVLTTFFELSHTATAIFLAIYVAVYAVIGIPVGLVKFRRFAIRNKNNQRKKRAEFLKENGYPGTVESLMNTTVPENLKEKWQKESAAWSKVAVDRSEAMMVTWVVAWPGILVHFLMADLLHELAAWVHRTVRGWVGKRMIAIRDEVYGDDEDFKYQDDKLR